MIKLGTRQEQKIGGQFSATEKKLHINALKLKTSLIGMKSLYKRQLANIFFIHINNTSALSAISEMSRMVSVDIYMSWPVKFEIGPNKTNSWVTATQIHRIFNIKADEESRLQDERA